MAAVDRISDQRVSYMSGMNPDLVSSASFQLAGQQGGMLSECFKNGETRYSVTATLKQNGLSLPIRFVPGEHCRDLYDVAGFETDARHSFESRVPLVRNAVTQGKIHPFD